MLHVQKYLLENGIDQLTQELGIEVKQYPEHGIMNLNYSQIDSPKTHPVVIECRGLILFLEKPYTVISRKFDRFFNHGEALDITQAFSGENAILGLKEDGSCIGVYYNPYTGTWNTSTRGSALAEGGFVAGGTFHQAVLKAFGLNDLTSFFGHKENTYIFEFVSPENFIVTPYENPSMVLTGIRKNLSGYEYNLSEMQEYVSEALTAGIRLELMKTYPFMDFSQTRQLANELTDLREGFVAWDMTNNLRVKVKSETYLLAHRMRGNGDAPTYKNMLELSLLGEKDEFLSYFPMFEKHILEPEQDIANFMEAVNEAWDKNLHIADQMEFALSINKLPFSSLLFAARAHKSTPGEVFHDLPIEKKMRGICVFVGKKY